MIAKIAIIERRLSAFSVQRSPFSHHRHFGSVVTSCHGARRQLRKSAFQILAITAIMAILAISTGCGYHTAGHAVRMPESLHTIAIPGFVNKTQTYRIEQILTRDVVREFISRTHYQVINSSSDSADAILKGIVVSTLAAPLTYDSQTGRASTAMVTITLKISLIDQSGRVLFENQNYTFRDVYQVSREIASFFDEETPALQRMSRDFARTLVNDILEGY
jgi:outer membrane lipopolysaccharide assembly protein LptE/RlpB